MPKNLFQKKLLRSLSRERHLSRSYSNHIKLMLFVFMIEKIVLQPSDILYDQLKYDTPEF